MMRATLRMPRDAEYGEVVVQGRGLRPGLRYTVRRPVPYDTDLALSWGAQALVSAGFLPEDGVAVWELVGTDTWAAEISAQ